MDERKKQEKAYKRKIKMYQPSVPYISNALKAFVVGGGICVIGQWLHHVYMLYFDLTEKTAVGPTLGTLILLAAILTGLGVYDKIGQFAGAGALAPVTGFSNAMSSAAIEHRSEGLVLGIAANMFKISGAVIVFGVVSAYLVGLTRLLVQMLIN